MNNSFYKKCFFLLTLCLVGINVYANNCNVIPKNTNQKIFISDELFILTANGLEERGQIIDEQKWQGDISMPVFVAKNKVIYFASHRYIIDKWDDLSGIYSFSVLQRPLNPVLFKSTTAGTEPAVSPNGNILAYKISTNEIHLLNLKNNESKKILDDSIYSPVVWINDHQFLYAALSKNITNFFNSLFKRKNRSTSLILFDIKTKDKIDLHMDGYFPSVLLPDGENVLLTDYENIVKYSLETKTKTILLKSKDRLTSQVIIWLPKLNGFLYTRHTPENDRNYNEMGNLFFYSLDKQDEVDLLNTFDLTGGFVVPDDVKLKPVDNEYNKVLTIQERIRKVCINN